MNDAEFKALIRSVVSDVVREVVAEAPVPAHPAPKEPPEPEELVRGPKHRRLPTWRSTEAVEALRRTTPARIVTGRTGARYLTESYLGLRADHAIAIDAVESQVAEGWPETQGWVPLKTRAKDHQEYLLHPDQGRRLDESSRSKCEKEADRSVDIQLIAGDGLSAVALLENGPSLIKALQRELSAAGFRLGRPLFVKHARIGVQDEIGVITQSKATLILVGERPGLGTGDSLSIYTAFAPKLGQDNSEKDCISNVRSLGFVPDRAAARCAELMKQTFAAGGGGVKLVTSEGS
ncbi:MAG: ethanolamine ammonia-lyase subunit EutC [Deltaproteobacteria bacterium]|nr:ethanolamine ammonia-lyase subunit EutC [Deltaproteobacteria bacterium]